MDTGAMRKSKKVICQAAWACKHKDDCVPHGHKHALGNDCTQGLCSSQPEMYRSKDGRRRKIRCLEPGRAALAAEKRRKAYVAFGA